MDGLCHLAPPALVADHIIRYMWPRAASVAEIATVVGMAPSTVRDRAKAMGLAARDRRGCAPTQNRSVFFTNITRRRPKKRAPAQRIVVSVTDGDIENAKKRWLELNGGPTKCPPAHATTSRQGRELGPVPSYEEPTGREALDARIAASVAKYQAQTKSQERDAA